MSDCKVKRVNEITLREINKKYLNSLPDEDIVKLFANMEYTYLIMQDDHDLDPDFLHDVQGDQYTTGSDVPGEILTYVFLTKGFGVSRAEAISVILRARNQEIKDNPMNADKKAI